MECDGVTELLPWHINGSLDTEERRAVAGHLAACDTCASELRATREAFELYDAHLPPAVLIDLAADRSPHGVAEELAEGHLAGCARCRGELELVRESRVALEAADRAPQAPVVPFAPRPRAARGVLPYLAAAASVATVVSLVGWLWTGRMADRRADQVALLEERVEAAERRTGEMERDWRERLAAAEQENGALREARDDLDRRLERDRDQTPGPQLNVAVVDLFSTALVTRGDGEQAPPVDIPPGAESLVLILNSQSLGADEGVAVELSTEAGTTVWTAAGLRRNPTGDFTVGVPVDSLQRGVTYRLLLSSPGGDDRETFVFRAR